MKLSFLMLSVLMCIGPAVAEEKTAEGLLKSMQTADMTYRELMEVMGKSSVMMHEGVLRHNKQMVEVGANFILTHPAPKIPPWKLMPEEDRKAFKSSLVAFDEMLDIHTRSIVESAKKSDWVGAADASNALMNACISCHTLWRDKVL